MKKKSWLTVLLMIILSSIAIIVRVYYVDRQMAEVHISEDIYNAAKVSVETTGLTSAFAGGFRMQSLYICNLYLAFLIFGNFTVSGVYLNILYQVLTVVLVYLIVRCLTNRYAAFAAGLLLAVFPPYIATLSEVSMQNMVRCIAALCSAVVILTARWVYRRRAVKKSAPGPETARQPARIEEEKDIPAQNAVADTGTSVLQDTSMREIRYDDLEDKKVKYIENPLPVPRRREHKEMDYAFEPAGSDDDYDVKDMTNKDFYDIE